MALKNSVTLQEYNQTLRDTVNAYYEHAIQDPGMSREEAIRSTQEMAEKYLAAVEEFQTNMETETLNNETAQEQGVENPGVETGVETGGVEAVGADGGIDGGDAGGIDGGGIDGGAGE